MKGFQTDPDDLIKIRHERQLFRLQWPHDDLVVAIISKTLVSVSLLILEARSVRLNSTTSQNGYIQGTLIPG